MENIHQAGDTRTRWIQLCELMRIISGNLWYQTSSRSMSNKRASAAQGQCLTLLCTSALYIQEGCRQLEDEGVHQRPEHVCVFLLWNNRQGLKSQMLTFAHISVQMWTSVLCLRNTHGATHIKPNHPLFYFLTFNMSLNMSGPSWRPPWSSTEPHGQKQTETERQKPGGVGP